MLEDKSKACEKCERALLPLRLKINGQKVVVVARSSDCMSYIEGNKAFWESGKTIGEAIVAMENRLAIDSP